MRASSNVIDKSQVGHVGGVVQLLDRAVFMWIHR